ncbi:unnamed protein product [Parnassius apollo]|uniref:(apollo) hypothetical protein n=1 Tax=Parnassius apollo TaxID=110799 RepID=A0A8S3XTW9_PARAO|nr:unnamed protein product [Parnassius apollo]
MPDSAQYIKTRPQVPSHRPSSRLRRVRSRHVAVIIRILRKKMARTKVNKRKKGNHTADNMLQAIRHYRLGWSIRKTAKEYNVCYPTLQHYIKKM